MTLLRRGDRPVAPTPRVNPTVAGRSPPDPVRGRRSPSPSPSPFDLSILRHAQDNASSRLKAPQAQGPGEGDRRRHVDGVRVQIVSGRSAPLAGEGRKIFRPYARRDLAHRRLALLRRGDACVAPTTSGLSQYSRTRVLPLTGPSAWFAPPPRSRRRKLRKWRRSSATPGPPGGRTLSLSKGRRGGGEGCGNLGVRFDVATRSTRGRTLSLSKGRRGERRRLR